MLHLLQKEKKFIRLRFIVICYIICFLYSNHYSNKNTLLQMDIPVYRLIDLARLLFFRALLLEAERRHDVSSSTSAHDTLQTARTHRRRAARRGRGVRPAGTPLSAHGSIHDSVLWIFAQCLIYAGSVLGVAGYLRSTQTAN